MPERNPNSRKRSAGSARRPFRYPRGAPGSFTLSLIVHASLLLLLTLGGAGQKEKQYELTEISYMEERYGAEVAKKVTMAPEKVAEIAEKKQDPKREGSMFAKAKPKPVAERATVMAANIVPLPKPVRKIEPKAFETPKLQSRTRRSSAPLQPELRNQSLALAPVKGSNPDSPTRIGSENVNLNGKALVGKKVRASKPVFEVSSDGPSLAAGGLTLVVPSGGVEGGHPELKGGTLPEGKQAYTGVLPTGQLKGGRSSRGDMSSLAGLDPVPGTAPNAGTALTAGIAAPSAGSGLISRGGSDAFSRGSMLKAKPGDHEQPAGAIVEIAPPKKAKDAEMPAQQIPQDEDRDVSMTLSGPVLGREIVSSTVPVYPEQARSRGWQGTVSIYFIVRPDGSIKKAVNEQASVYQALDEAARNCIMAWRFKPLTGEGAKDQWGVLTIVFKLR